MFVELTYRDGSANTYHFHAEDDGARFEYVPVRPEDSSTGIYSGGEPRSGRLDAATLATLWQHVSDLASDPARHLTERAKGTGAFAFTDANGTRTFIVRRCPELATFDAFVAQLR